MDEKRIEEYPDDNMGFITDFEDSAEKDNYEDSYVIGKGFEIIEDEPLPQESPLWEMENVVITPHNSFVSPKNNERLFSVMLQNIETFLKERAEK